MQSLMDTIGNTPLVKLQYLSPNPDVTILAKLEYFNPTGSIKDRIVVHIIKRAEHCGRLAPGGTIIEATSGNTGAAAAMIGGVKGYRVILTMPDKVSKEKQKTLLAFGAEIRVAPTSAPPDSPEHYVNLAKRLEAEIPGSFRINQYDNPLNPEAHYLTTGPEIWRQAEENIDYLVAGGSTGGTISGIGRYLKERDPWIAAVLADPAGSIYHDYFHGGKAAVGVGTPYRVEGVGEDHITKALDWSLIDNVVRYTDADAFRTARLLARKEGIFAGGSSGGSMWVALEIAKTALSGTVIVVVLPDSGLKYLSKIYDDEWLTSEGITP